MPRSQIKGPSEHLFWIELDCKDGTPYPIAFISDGRVYKLAQVFEFIRGLYDKPIVVLSAYRTPAHNKKIGGARNSQHLEGRALDLKPPKGVSVARFYYDIRAHMKEFEIKGLGRYKTFVHVDIRPGNVAFWSGTGTKDSK